MAVVTQTNTGTVSKTTLGKLPRDGVERIWASRARRYYLDLNKMPYIVYCKAHMIQVVTVPVDVGGLPSPHFQRCGFYACTQPSHCELHGLILVSLHRNVSSIVLEGSPSSGGDVTVTNQTFCPLLLSLFLCRFLSLWPFQLYFNP